MWNNFTFRNKACFPVESVQSSNWRDEFTNIVESLEDEGNMGNLINAEVFMFTDNSTVEACTDKGLSTSSKLLDLLGQFLLTSIE